MSMMGEPAGGDKGFHVFHVAWVEGEDDQAGRWGILYLALSNVSIVQCFFPMFFAKCDQINTSMAESFLFSTE